MKGRGTKGNRKLSGVTCAPPFFLFFLFFLFFPPRTGYFHLYQIHLPPNHYTPSWCCTCCQRLWFQSCSGLFEEFRITCEILRRRFNRFSPQHLPRRRSESKCSQRQNSRDLSPALQKWLVGIFCAVSFCPTFSSSASVSLFEIVVLVSCV